MSARRRPPPPCAASPCRCTSRRLGRSPRLPDRLLAHLRRWKEAQDREIAEEIVASGLNDKPPLRKRAVVEFGGEPVKRISKAFSRVMAAAGIAEASPHTLRHTAATWLMQNGCEVWTAAGFLGMTAQTLEANYGHHHPGHQQSAREAIGRRTAATR